MRNKSDINEFAKVLEQFGDRWLCDTTDESKNGICENCVAWEIGKGIDTNIIPICDKLNLDNFGDKEYCMNNKKIFTSKLTSIEDEEEKLKFIESVKNGGRL